jgi:general secretion pathway protein K
MTFTYGAPPLGGSAPLPPKGGTPYSKRASILVGLLWCVAILSIIVIGTLHSSSLGLMATKNYADKIQAHYLALAGVEKTKALLFHEYAARKKAMQNHSGDLYNSPADFREVKFGRGNFSVIRQEGRETIFGISDEESRLNVNTCSLEELSRIEDMPPEVAAAIIDWRDRDNSALPGGAERDYYASLKPPYIPRNADFGTLREMLLVRGVTSELLLGEDENQNGLLDPEEDDGDEIRPRDNQNGSLERGWSGIFCLQSLTANKNAGGQTRVNIKSAGESDLAAVPGISQDIAKAIVGYRGQKQFENITDLLDVAQVQQQGGPGQNRNQPGRPGQPQQQGNAQTVGPKLISEDLFEDIIDNLTIDDAAQQKGLININTASLIVLRCLNGMTDELAQAVINYRSSAGFFASIGGLLKVPGFNRDLLRQIAPRLTTRSETFHIVSEGRVESTGARERIEAVIRFAGSTVDTIYYRENL